MEKKQKCIHRIVLLTLCYVLLFGSLTFSEVHFIKAASRRETVSTIIKSAKKNTKDSDEKSSNSSKKQSSKKSKKSAKKTTKKSTKSTQKKTKNGKTSYEYSWITLGSTGDKNFDGYISKFKIEVGSLINFLTVIAIIAAGISIRIIGVKFAWTKNGAKRSEHHEQLITIILVVCAILGLGTILALAKQIGESLF